MAKKKAAAVLKGSAIKTCGIIMPISEIDGCSEDHWAEVFNIVADCIEAAGFIPNMVSHTEESTIIHKTILQNLYENPIVVCDVSGKNPNVMFELGMRLAFDKPTIVIKDDQTNYSFDTSPIEHLEYPRDLRYAKIIEFKESLIEKIQSTAKKSAADKNYSTFLKHLGTFKAVQIQTDEVSKDVYLIDEIKSIKDILTNLTTQATGRKIATIPAAVPMVRRRTLCMRKISSEKADEIFQELSAVYGQSVQRCIPGSGEDHFHVAFDRQVDINHNEILQTVRKNHTDVLARWL